MLRAPLARGRKCILTKVDAFIAFEVYAALGQLIDDEALAAPEVEYGLRGGILDEACDAIMEPPEAQPVDRVPVGVFCDVPFGCVVADCCCVHAAWTSFIIAAVSRSLRASSGAIWPSSIFVVLRIV